ncbi:MAG: lytic transglycosylase domain-containing protein [Acidobacteriaceae bacterium]
MKVADKISMAALLVAICATPLHGAERVYLRSGADIVCDHRAAVDGQVRLYLTASQDNYLQVAAGDVLRTEPVAEVPSPAAAAAPVAKSAADLNTLLQQAGSDHHLDPDLLASVVRAESGGRSRAVSRAGAQGLMQLMPQTAAVLGVQDSFAPDENVAGGTAYLDALLTHYHDNLALALAAYNAGPAAVDRYRGVPPYAETRRYVQRIIHDYNRRKLQEMRRPAIHGAQLVSMAAASSSAQDKLTTR